MAWTTGLYAMAALYVMAGLNHLRAPGFYLPMIPPYVPFPVFCNGAAGIVEILLGIGLLFEPTRPAASGWIVAMLIVFLSVHVYMLQERNGVFARVPEWLLWARLPGQAGLMAWAFVYTKVRT